MATFAEMKAQLDSATSRKTILRHLADYLDEQFRMNAGLPPKQVLLTDEKLPVHAMALDAVAEMLGGQIRALDVEIGGILGAAVAPPPPATPQVQEQSVQGK